VQISLSISFKFTLDVATTARSGALRKSISPGSRLIRRWLLPGHILIKISATARYSPFFGVSPPVLPLPSSPRRRTMNPVSLVNVLSHRESPAVPRYFLSYGENLVFRAGDHLGTSLAVGETLAGALGRPHCAIHARRK